MRDLLISSMEAAAAAEWASDTVFSTRAVNYTHNDIIAESNRVGEYHESDTLEELNFES